MMTLAILRNAGRVFYRMSLSWDSSDVFLMIGQGYGFGEENHRREGPFSWYLIKGVHHHLDLSLPMLTLNTWLRSPWSVLSTTKLLFVFPSTVCPLEGCHSSGHPQGLGVMLHLLVGLTATCIPGVLLSLRLVSSPP